MHLDLIDVDLAQRVLVVRQGKGKKDRVVPLGRLAVRFIERYIREARVATRSHARALFVSDIGQRLTESHVRRYILQPAPRRAGIQKHVALHVLRHSCALHLLENGASVRHIQAPRACEALDDAEVPRRDPVEAEESARGRAPRRAQHEAARHASAPAASLAVGSTAPSVRIDRIMQLRARRDFNGNGTLPIARRVDRLDQHKTEYLGGWNEHCA